MPVTLTASHTALTPATVAELPYVSLILALYASDYDRDRHAAPDKIAAFIIEGANRWGLEELIVRTCRLVTFWQYCADRVATSETWSAHQSLFDGDRIIRCSGVLEARPRAIRRALAALAAEAVTA